MWVATEDLPRSAAHPFDARLNQILDQHDFDGFVEGLIVNRLPGTNSTYVYTRRRPRKRAPTPRALQSAPKVFKLGRVTLAPRERIDLKTTFSLAVHTTQVTEARPSRRGCRFERARDPSRRV